MWFIKTARMLTLRSSNDISGHTLSNSAGPLCAPGASPVSADKEGALVRPTQASAKDEAWVFQGQMEHDMTK